MDIQEVEVIKGLPQYLGAGEKAAISLAVRQGIKQVFLDEAKARAVARFHGLKPVGTLGILWRVYQKGNLSSDEIKRLMFSLVRPKIQDKGRNSYRISRKAALILPRSLPFTP